MNTFIEQYDINIDNNAPVISEISKTIFDENGGYIRNEIIEYTVTFMETERNVATYSLNNNVVMTIYLDIIHIQMRCIYFDYST